MAELLPYLLITAKKFIQKKSLLVICKILRLFVNTSTVNDKYSLDNRDNLRQPIEMLLLKKKMSIFYSILEM